MEIRTEIKLYDTSLTVPYQGIEAKCWTYSGSEPTFNESNDILNWSGVVPNIYFDWWGGVPYGALSENNYAMQFGGRFANTERLKVFVIGNAKVYMDRTGETDPWELDSSHLLMEVTSASGTVFPIGGVHDEYWDNGDFEVWVNNNGVWIPEGWEPYGDPDWDELYVLKLTPGVNGQGCALWLANESAPASGTGIKTPGLRSEYVDIGEKDSISIFFYYRGTGIFYVEAFDAGYNSLGYTSKSVSGEPEDEWTLASLEWDLPASTRYVRLYLVVQASPSGRLVFNVDDIYFNISVPDYINPSLRIDYWNSEKGGMIGVLYKGEQMWLPLSAGKLKEKADSVILPNVISVTKNAQENGVYYIDVEVGLDEQYVYDADSGYYYISNIPLRNGSYIEVYAYFGSDKKVIGKGRVVLKDYDKVRKTLRFTIEDFSSLTREQFVQNYPNRASYMLVEANPQLRGVVNTAVRPLAYDGFNLGLAVVDLLAKAGIDSTLLDGDYYGVPSINTSVYLSHTQKYGFIGNTTPSDSEIEYHHQLDFGTYIGDVIQGWAEAYNYRAYFNNNGDYIFNPIEPLVVVPPSYFAYVFDKSTGSSPSCLEYAYVVLGANDEISYRFNGEEISLLFYLDSTGTYAGNGDSDDVSIIVKTTDGEVVAQTAKSLYYPAWEIDGNVIEMRGYYDGIDSSGANPCMVNLRLPKRDDYIVYIKALRQIAFNGLLIKKFSIENPKVVYRTDQDIIELPYENLSSEVRNDVVVVGTRMRVVAPESSPDTQYYDYVYSRAIDLNSIYVPSAKNYIGFPRQMMVLENTVNNQRIADWLATNILLRYNSANWAARVNRVYYDILDYYRPVKIIDVEKTLLPETVWVIGWRESFQGQNENAPFYQVEIETTSVKPFQSYYPTLPPLSGTTPFVNVEITNGNDYDPYLAENGTYVQLRFDLVSEGFVKVWIESAEPFRTVDGALHYGPLTYLVGNNETAELMSPGSYYIYKWDGIWEETGFTVPWIDAEIGPLRVTSATSNTLTCENYVFTASGVEGKYVQVVAGFGENQQYPIVDVSADGHTITISGSFDRVPVPDDLFIVGKKINYKVKFEFEDLFNAMSGSYDSYVDYEQDYITIWPGEVGQVSLDLDIDNWGYEVESLPIRFAGESILPNYNFNSGLENWNYSGSVTYSDLIGRVVMLSSGFVTGNAELYTNITLYSGTYTLNVARLLTRNGAQWPPLLKVLIAYPSTSPTTFWDNESSSWVSEETWNDITPDEYGSLEISDTIQFGLDGTQDVLIKLKLIGEGSAHIASVNLKQVTYCLYGINLNSASNLMPVITLSLSGTKDFVLPKSRMGVLYRFGALGFTYAFGYNRDYYGAGVFLSGNSVEAEADARIGFSVLKSSVAISFDTNDVLDATGYDILNDMSLSAWINHLPDRRPGEISGSYPDIGYSSSEVFYGLLYECAYSGREWAAYGIEQRLFYLVLYVKDRTGRTPVLASNVANLSFDVSGNSTVYVLYFIVNPDDRNLYHIREDVTVPVDSSKGILNRGWENDPDPYIQCADLSYFYNSDNALSYWYSLHKTIKDKSWWYYRAYLPSYGPGASTKLNDSSWVEVSAPADPLTAPPK